MDRLYCKILKVSSEKDMNAVWEIIEQYRPYIINECIDIETNLFDEDLMSEIMTKLPSRILNYKPYK